MSSLELVLDLLSRIGLHFQIVVVEMFVDPWNLSRVECGATGPSSLWCYMVFPH